MRCSYGQKESGLLQRADARDRSPFLNNDN